MLAMKQKKITVNIHQAKTTLSRLIEAAQKGHHVVIARDGNPVVELVPVAPAVERKPGMYPEMHVSPDFFEPISPEDLADWEGR